VRILLVTTEIASSHSPSGGLANSIERFATALRSFGHTTTLLGPGNAQQATFGPDIATFPARPGPAWRFIDALTLRRFNMGVTSIARARSVTRIIRELDRVFRPDVILYPNLGGIGLFRPPKIPSVIRVSSDTQSSWNHGGYDNQSSFAMRQQIALENAALRRADAAYAPSSTTALRLTQRLRRRVDVFRTPFFLETLDEDDSILREQFSGKSFLVFVGLLNRLKGVTIIGDMLPPLLSRHTNLHFIFVGKEHAGFQGKTMQNHILDLADRVKDRIHFLGELPHEQLYPLIRGAKAVVLPSLVDNLPNTCLEAMALGKVVIGTEGTSFEELLDDGVSGVLCRPGDSLSLEKAIERLLALSESQLISIGQRAEDTARHFGPDQTIPPLVEYFEKVIQKHHSKAPKGRL